MNIAEIKSAVDAGQSVHWTNEGYRVHRDALGQYLITYLPNGSSIGLTDRSGTKLNGDEASFFVSRPDLGVTVHCRACDGEANLIERPIRDYGAASGFSSTGCDPARTIAETGKETGARGEVAGTDPGGVSC